MALDATIGGASSDSYITVADADAYHDTHLYASDWTSAVTGDKEKALKMATRILDERIDWVGSKLADSQALRWPRSNVIDRDGYSVATTEIPSDVKNATAEFARHLIATDSTANSDGKGISELKVDSIELKFDKADTSDVLPQIVSEMLRGWGNISGRAKFGTVSVVRS